MIPYRWRLRLCWGNWPCDHQHVLRIPGRGRGLFCTRCGRWTGERLPSWPRRGRRWPWVRRARLEEAQREIAALRAELDRAVRRTVRVEEP